MLDEKAYESMASYLRQIRPYHYLKFDRLVRLMLNWFDRNKIKEKDVFFELEGDEYQSFKTYIDTELEEKVNIDKEFVKKMFEFSVSTR